MLKQAVGITRSTTHRSPSPAPVIRSLSMALGSSASYQTFREQIYWCLALFVYLFWVWLLLNTPDEKKLELIQVKVARHLNVSIIASPSSVLDYLI